MAKSPDDGRVWGRPEALDTLGRQPGRRRRSFGMVLGVAAIAAGAYLGFTGPAIGQTDTAAPATGEAAPPTARATCASIGVSLSQNRIPAEGIAESSVVRLSRADADGAARMIVPEAYVLRAAPQDDGSVQVSVLVRTTPVGEDTVEQVNGANADRTLSAAVLYDVDPLQVLDDCRSGS
jgi:hypothetical protein